MSLNSTITRSQYTGTNLVKIYAYAYKIISDSDLLVVVRNISTGVETELTKTTDYTVSGVGSTAGGNITLVDADQAWLNGEFLSSDYKIAILRRRSITQAADIKNQGDYYPETIETAFDKATMVDQQQQDQIDRAIKFPDTFDISDFDPELPATLAGQSERVIGTNVAGDGFSVGPSFTEIGTAQAASIAAQAAADAAAESETNAAASELAADASADDAADSAAAAATSEANAAASAVAAAQSAEDAAAAGLGVVVTGTRATPQDIGTGGITYVNADGPLQTWFVQGNGGPIIVSGNPAISAAATVGRRLRLIGRSDTNTLTLNDGNGLDLNGPVVLGASSVIDLEFDGTNWVETSRR